MSTLPPHSMAKLAVSQIANVLHPPPTWRALTQNTKRVSQILPCVSMMKWNAGLVLVATDVALPAKGKSGCAGPRITLNVRLLVRYVWRERYLSVLGASAVHIVVSEQNQRAFLPVQRAKFVILNVIQMD